MTLPLSKEQIEAIQARAEKAKKHSMFIAEYRSSIDEHINALCQQALRAIELEAKLKEVEANWDRDTTVAADMINTLQSELTAARNALEEERERCAKAVLESGTNGFMNEFEANCAAIVIRKLPSPLIESLTKNETSARSTISDGVK